MGLPFLTWRRKQIQCSKHCFITFSEIRTLHKIHKLSGSVCYHLCWNVFFNDISTEVIKIVPGVMLISEKLSSQLPRAKHSHHDHCSWSCRLLRLYRLIHLMCGRNGRSCNTTYLVIVVVCFCTPNSQLSVIVAWRQISLRWFDDTQCVAKCWCLPQWSSNTLIKTNE
jgi:hypothetical protein